MGIDFILDGKIALEVKEKGSRPDYLKLSRSAASLGIKEKYVVSRGFSPIQGFIPAVEV